MIKLFKVLGVLAAFCVSIYVFTLETIFLPPDYSIVLAKGQEFYTPPCVMKKGYDDYYEIIAFASDNGFEVFRFDNIPKEIYPAECGELAERKRTFYCDLEGWGILPKSRQRWNQDGSWNY